MRSKVLVLCFLLAACVSQKNLFKSSVYFPEPAYDFKKNPLQKENIELGRLLFYDPILSADSSISCSSCHSSYNAFAHTDHALSHGIRDSIGSRNAPALMNLAWQKTFMWDGAIHHLDVQALAPISHPKEMASNIEDVIKKLNQNEKYTSLFSAIYNDHIINTERLMKSLAQFQLTLISDNAKYDSVQRKQAHFTEQEKTGYEIFKRHCNSCHQEPLFSSYDFANNGLPLDHTLKDLGRFKVTQQPKDSFLFKVPSLRNLSYTYPYMHDGRFKTLQQVLNHYEKGVVKSTTLATTLQGGIRLTANEKIDLIAFLLTLSDKKFVFDKRFSFPKK